MDNLSAADVDPRMLHFAPTLPEQAADHIRHIREKIEINPAEPRYLKAAWGQGYKIERGKT